MHAVKTRAVVCRLLSFSTHPGAGEKAPLGESDRLICSRWTEGGQGIGNRSDLGYMHISGRQVWELAVERHVGI